jgi:hypothetical protein
LRYRSLSEVARIITGVRLIIGGHVVFDGGDSNADLPDALSAPESVVDGGSHRYRFAVVPLRVNGEPASLQDGADATAVEGTIARLRSTLLLVIPIILALCVAGGYWMSAWALTPVNEVSGALARIGPRDLRQRLPLSQVHDETRQLTEAINQLLSASNAPPPRNAASSPKPPMNCARR